MQNFRRKQRSKRKAAFILQLCERHAWMHGCMSGRMDGWNVVYEMPSFCNCADDEADDDADAPPNAPVAQTPISKSLHAEKKAPRTYN